MADAAVIDQEIVRLQLRMNGLFREMQGLKDIRLRKQKEADCFKAFLSPVRLIPSEILARIFSYCCSGEFRPRLDSSPLRLGHVCSLWRNAAVNSPGLWDTLLMNFFKWSDLSSNPRRLRGLLSFWFTNASIRSLTLALSADRYYQGPQVILEELRPFSARISTLRLETGEIRSLAPFLHLPGGHIPSLATLSLYANGAGTGTPITVFDSAQCLQAVLLAIDPVIIGDTSHFIFPWSQLTRLDIRRRLPLGVWYNIFLQCVHLHDGAFFLAWDVDFNPGTGHPVPVIYERLLRLKIEKGPAQDVSLFENLSLPALQFLDYAGEMTDDDAFPMTTHVLPHISSSTIRFLILAQVEVDVVDFINFLLGCSLLERHAFDFLDVDHGNLLQSLIRALQSRLFLPVLSHFAVFIPSPDLVDYPFYPSAIIDLIEELCGAPRPRQPDEISVYVYQTINPETGDNYEVDEAAEKLVRRIRGKYYDEGVSESAMVVDSGLDLSSTLCWKPRGMGL
ncbi:hypothetical protein Hypma_010272 [Hypsizygus marmoreus]|uniref:Uncharacterized protein n=1 Tax=Hypsizygus marmoreus TaxID=39966 RepID=A0A369JRZ4_HYPMA|nr:hypothetical protein Hypma_010272 [Hypsizygus marmoreus]